MVRKRAATRRSARGKKMPGWALLLMGLGGGVFVSWAIYLYTHRTTHHTPALATVVPTLVPLPSTPKNTRAPKNNPVTTPGVTKSVKPHFDFYTILPEIETVLPDKEPKRSKSAKTTKQDDSARYILQAASFGNFSDADNLKARLALAGMEAYIEKITIADKGNYYRVRLGPYNHIEQLDAADKRLAKTGIKAIRLKVKKLTNP